jgi:hypothetical protein
LLLYTVFVKVVADASMGETLSSLDLQRSMCGEQFDEYVLQALDLFPWSHVVQHPEK